MDRLDQNIGRVLAKPEEIDAREDTLILFLSDNGSCPMTELEHLVREKSEKLAPHTCAQIMLNTWSLSPGVKHPAQGALSGSRQRTQRWCCVTSRSRPGQSSMTDRKLLRLLVSGRSRDSDIVRGCSFGRRRFIYS